MDSDFKLEPLSDLKSFKKLPPLRLQFFTPRLAEKPQDPILETLHLLKDRPSLLVNSSHALPDADSMAPLNPSLPLGTLSHDDADFWIRALEQGHRGQMQIKSWDNLRAPVEPKAGSTPFLSEQLPDVFASVRYYVNPRVSNPSVHVAYATEDELLESIRSAVLGTSSRLFRWMEDSEKFIVFGSKLGTQEVSLLVGEWDEHLVANYIERFLITGTALRRLDIFIDGLRQRVGSAASTTHSLAHALSSTVDYYRTILATTFEANASWRELSSALWLQHEDIETVVTSLGAMCGRSVSQDPAGYSTFTTNPEDILSLIYTFLGTHIDRYSPKVVVATFAFLLTVTCTDYFENLGRSVGFTQDVRDSQTRIDMGVQSASGNEPEEEEISEELGNHTIFPKFISPRAVEAIIRARMSLKLLHVAKPDFTASHDTSRSQNLTWLWTAKEIVAALDGASLEQCPVELRDERSSADIGSQVEDSNAISAAFRVFDLEPGTHVTNLLLHSQSYQALESFIDSFPEELPALTPTLPHLSELVLAPLINHCYSISSSLLSHILSTVSPLHIVSHLRLIRDYLLLTSPSFQRRLSQALLSDYDSWDFEGNSARALARRSSHPATPTVSGDTWAIGLGLGLSERTSWPPGGADLSFYLRTVILDSLATTNNHDDDDVASEEILVHQHIMTEAESRLGFSIRDLPSDSGRERWLDPCSIEALDFLLMTYKAQPPLDVIITDGALSKCQRIFTFMLRLMRVQHAVNALYRMTRDSRDPLFPTLTQTNRQLLHLRFMAHGFVDTIASYIFDFVMREKYDLFLSKLASDQSAFADIFNLAEAYSTVLDDILSACLLRSTQRTAADLLRSCLETVLDLCTVCGEMRRAKLEEYRAAPLIKELSDRFRRRMTALVKTLKSMVDRESASTLLPQEYAHLASDLGAQLPTGGPRGLYHLLLKLDMSGWWSKANG